jgi:hypothetical protein
VQAEADLGVKDLEDLLVRRAAHHLAMAREAADDGLAGLGRRQ